MQLNVKRDPEFDRKILTENTPSIEEYVTNGTAVRHQIKHTSPLLTSSVPIRNDLSK